MSSKPQAQNVRKPYAPKENRQICIESALECIRTVMGNNRIMRRHKERVIREMIWKITECDGKFKTQYRSEMVMFGANDALVEHEHVTTIESLISEILANPKELDKLKNNIMACLVTEEEHKKLKRRDNGNGWERYKRAGIHVIDVKNNKRLF